jgi:hypothetical protein
MNTPTTEIKELVESAMKWIHCQLSREHELKHEFTLLEQQIDEARQASRMHFVEKMATQAGVNLSEILEEAGRRHKVQRRLVRRGYKRFREKALGLSAAEREQSIRDFNRRAEEMEARFSKTKSNPYMVFAQCVDGAVFTSDYRDPPGALVGGSDPELSHREYSDDVTPKNGDYHWFRPRVYAATGDDDRNVIQGVRQSMFLRPNAVESGRGPFTVNEVRLYFGAWGYAEAHEGDVPCFGPGRLGPAGGAFVDVRVELLQTAPDVPDWHNPVLYPQQPVWESVGSFSDSFQEILWRRPHEFEDDGPLVFDPSDGASEPWVHVLVDTHVWASGKDGWAELDCSAANLGMRLAFVRLEGDYQR